MLLSFTLHLALLQVTFHVVVCCWSPCVATTCFSSWLLFVVTCCLPYVATARLELLLLTLHCCYLPCIVVAFLGTHFTFPCVVVVGSLPYVVIAYSLPCVIDVTFWGVEHPPPPPPLFCHVQVGAWSTTLKKRKEIGFF